MYQYSVELFVYMFYSFANTRMIEYYWLILVDKDNEVE